MAASAQSALRVSEILKITYLGYKPKWCIQMC